MNKKKILKFAAGCGIIGILVSIIMSQNRKYRKAVLQGRIADDVYECMMNYMEERVKKTQDGYEEILDYVKDELEDMLEVCDGTLNEAPEKGEK